MLENLTSLFLGWLLGLLGPVVVDRIRRQYTRKEFMRAVVTELQDLQFRMAILAYRLRTHLGTLDEPFLEWAQKIIEGYSGPENDPQTIETFRKMKGVTPQQRAALFAMTKKPGTGPVLSRIPVGYLLGQTTSWSICPIGFQQRMGQVRTHLEFLNEEVGRFIRMYELTFTPSLSEENYSAALENIETSYKNIAERAEILANVVSEIGKSSRSS